MRRELGAAVLLCLAGSVLLLLAGGRAWAVVPGDAPAPLPAVETRLSGADLVPGLRALALVGLAGVPALVAARARLRPVVGGLLLVCGAAPVLLVVGVLRDPGAAVAGAGAAVPSPEDLLVPLGPGLALLGGALLALAGLLVLLRGRRWSGLARRYDAPAARPSGPEDPERDAWESLDRGQDPTR